LDNKELQDGDSLCSALPTLPRLLSSTTSTQTSFGLAMPTHWDFSLSDLYPSFAIDDQDLTEPFFPMALFAMDSNSSLRPDSFGPPLSFL
jgi:hypothetical protein